jgi:probable HAF family extracellular repeat protein
MGFSQVPRASAPTVIDRYELTALGLLNAGGYAYSKDINNRGEVTGTALAVNGLSEHAYVWSGGVMTDLGTLGAQYSWGHAINDEGEVAGYSVVDPNTIHGFLHSGGTMSSTHPGTENFSRNNGISAWGDVAGIYSGVFGGWANEYRAYYTWAGTHVLLGTFGGTESRGEDVNDFGEVVGMARTSEGKARAFTCQGTMLTEIGDLGDVYSWAKAINNTGAIVGVSRPRPNEYHGFHWVAGIMRDLGTFGGPDSEGRDVNDAGQIVGFAEDPSMLHRAAIWQGAHRLDLNDLVVNLGGWVLTGASGINELGEICGTGQLNGVQRAFKLTPILRQPRGSRVIPGMAGVPNHVWALGAAPGAALELWGSFQRGTSSLPGCTGVQLDMGSAMLLATATADAEGRASFEGSLGASSSGQRLRTQVVAPATCEVAPMIVQQIR